MELNYTLTKLQTQIFTSKADIVEWSGDYGVGKTFLAKMKLIAYLLENAGSVGVYMCPTHQQLRHQMLLVPDSFKKLTVEFAETSHTYYHIEFHNGSILYFLPMDKVAEANLFVPNIVVVDGLHTDTKISSLPRTRDFNKIKSFMLINRSGGENKIVETSKVKEPVNPYIKPLRPIDDLGNAISDSGRYWTNEMRNAWDKAKAEDEKFRKLLAGEWVLGKTHK